MVKKGGFYCGRKGLNLNLNLIKNKKNNPE